MSKFNNINKNNYINDIWIKNFYYNRTSILKLIFLFSFLNNNDFISNLSKKIQNFNFEQSLEAKNILLKINDSFLVKANIFELSFGYVWIFESHIVYYFKENFDFDDFYDHFSKIDETQEIFWVYGEFFDKTIKILEIFKKKSFIRIFRDETINDSTLKVKNIKKEKIKINEKESYLFLKKYEPKRIKFILYFYKN